ncbi:MAG: hypothetical protein GY909_17260 [Oligoflexia bacterium]|nr:hypothetical protein [Oligoflexia bacterium]
MKVIDDENEINLQLLRIKDSDSRIEFWAPVKVGVLASSGHLNHFNQVNNEFRIVLDEPEVFEDNNISKKTATRFYIPDLGIEFYSHFVNGVQRGPWWFATPETIKVHERRELERFYPMRSASVTLEKEGKTFKRKLYDISAGGFSILLSKSDIVNIKEDELFKDIKLSIDTVDLSVKAVVVKIRKAKPFKLENTPYAFKRVSFRFLDLTPRMQEQLNKLLVTVFD